MGTIALSQNVSLDRVTQSPAAQADLELVEHRVLDGRVLVVEYHPTGKDIPRA